jgi:hypothetical protein
MDAKLRAIWALMVIALMAPSPIVAVAAIVAIAKLASRT